MLRGPLSVVAGAASLTLATCAPRPAAPAPPTPAAPASAPALQAPPSPASGERPGHRPAAPLTDSTGGRGITSRANLGTSEGVAAAFARAGLAPLAESGGYFQTIPLARVALDSTKGLAVGGTLLRAGIDVVPVGIYLDWSVDSTTAIYGGVTNDSTTWPDAERCRGKLVVMKPPQGADFNVVMHTIFLLRHNPRFRGVAGFAVAALEQAPRWLFQRVVEGQLSTEALGFHLVRGSVLVSAAGASTLIGAPLATAAIGQMGPAVHAEVVFRRFPLSRPLRNVVAVLPGSDSALSRTYVAITAPQDLPEGFSAAVGTSPSGAGGPGTAALVGLARELAGGPRPRRSILFVAHAGEPLDLLGSRWFTDHPTIPRDSIVAVIALGLTGRGTVTGPGAGDSGYVQAVGSRRVSSEFGNLLEAVAAHEPVPPRLSYEYDAPQHPLQAYCRSAAFSYGRYGIPSVALWPGDDRDSAQAAAPVVRLARDLARAVADLDHRPVVDGRRQDPRAPCRQ
jgi:hypothetical protein